MSFLISPEFWIGLVILFHFAAMLGEIVFGVKVFERVSKLSLSDAPEGFSDAIRKTLQNQGVYNGFLAVGLLLSFRVEVAVQNAAQIFLLACAVIAGVVGYVTFRRWPFLVLQSGLAVVALVLRLSGR